MAPREIEGLRVNPEQAQAFRPGSRRVDLKGEELRIRFPTHIINDAQGSIPVLTGKFLSADHSTQDPR
jgi:hypothetical protein